MNRIILAYCHDNAELAHVVEQHLSRIGIPFEHLTDQQGDTPGTFGRRLAEAEDPVVLFVTENLLKSRFCMSGALGAIQNLLRNRQLLLVVADGKISADGGATFQYVETHFDRMGHALQYMNFWQNAWLDLSNRHQHASGTDKVALESEMNEVHHIANEVGEVINVLREAGYMSQAQFEADNYAAFFRQFGLEEWHHQYAKIASTSDQDVIPPIPPTAPAEPLAEPPVFTGLLAPEPSGDDLFEEDTPGFEGQIAEMEALPDQKDDAPFEIPEEMPAPDVEIEDISLPEAEEEIPVSETDESQVEQAIHDAWFWLEQGHTERGFELFQFALEQHPDNERIKAAFSSAQEKYAPGNTPVAEADAPPAPLNGQGPTEVVEENEAKSYELMGDMAAEKGDYLFAKYCWDRAAEIDPDYPGIYRKLGLMTSEHLQDYRETAVHYLNKALAYQPEDAAVHLALANALLQNGDRQQAENHYSRAVMLNPALRTAGNDKLFRHVEQPVYAPEPEMPEPEMSPEQVSEPQPAGEKPAVLTVLITGATSGIGQATAEIFARHGHRVILTGRRVERLVLLKTQYEEEYRSDVLMLPFDVRDHGAVLAALDNLPEPWQQIDVLVNNAGLAKGLAPIHEGNPDHWNTMIDTNIKGLLYVTRAVAPGMVARRSGHIINVGSSAGKEVYPKGNVYCATKFAVDALTRAMRLDLYEHNIRVSQVSPGHTEETEFALNRFDGDAERAKIYGDFQPLKSRDVAEAIYFMATRPPHVNVQDVWMYSTQQASSTLIDRSGRP